MLALLRTLIAKALHLDQGLRPVILHLTVTNRCNSRCSACNLWQETDKKDISLETIDRYRQSSLAKHLRILDITGGEPFLCDLPGMIGRLNNGKIRTLIISTNASLPEKIVQDLAAIRKITKAQILLNVSLDGIEDVHDQIRGIPESYAKAMATVSRLNELALNRCAIIWKMTVIKKNIDQMIPCFERAKNLGIAFSCKPGAHYEFLKNTTSNFQLTTAEYALIIENLKQIIRHMENQQNFMHAPFWERLYRITNIQFHKELIAHYQLLKNGEEKMPFPCYASFFSTLLHCDQKMYCCPKLMRPFGDLTISDPDALWKSSAAQEARAMIRRGQCACFSQCDQMPAIVMHEALPIAGQLLKSYCHLKQPNR